MSAGRVWVSAFPFPVGDGVPSWRVRFWTDGKVTLDVYAERARHTLTLTREQAGALADALRWPR